MRIKEILLDRLIATELFEMAFDRQLEKNRVIDLSPQIFDHLLKLLVVSGETRTQNARIWEVELDAWFGQIDRIYLKSSKKKPTTTELYQWLVLNAAPIIPRSMWAK